MTSLCQITMTSYYIKCFDVIKNKAMTSHQVGYNDIILAKNNDIIR